ncbi:hypothetical protein NQ315_007310 [Exocentrus adspersus]|uniref:Uncharacterized protein n=1 Tax=Exocentrus adspersus TaxID=1586481 RepID=A0AAV8WD18_9CUCU|nr:hypothetical protein NQ315_007310 [Exocentrus adspersus]
MSSPCNDKETSDTSPSLKMLKLKYDPVHGYDYSYGFDRPYIPDYRIHRPYDFYFDWPWRYRLWLPNRPFRRFLNKELRLRELIYTL